MDGQTPKSPKSRRRDTGDSRAERKRVQDRLAQRATRERTKNRISYLEQRLSSLEAGDKHGEITSLTRIIDDLRNDNNRLRSALVRIRTAIDQTVLETEDKNGVQSEPQSCNCSTQARCACPQVPYLRSASVSPQNGMAPLRQQSSSPEVVSEETETVNAGKDESNACVEENGLFQSDINPELFDFSPSTLLEMFEFGGASSGYNAWHSRSPSPFDYRFPPPVMRVAPDLEKWEVSNGAFIGCLDSVKKRKASNSTLDMHVPFKAVIWGWDNVGDEANHPVWSALRQVDQRVFGTWTSKAQRIALMYVCQTLIQYREQPTRANLDRVPVFLRPRPSQENIQHPAVIDFLIW